MSIALRHDLPSVSSPTTQLVVVRERSDNEMVTAVQGDVETGMGRAVVIGSIIGFLGTFAAFTGVAVAVGLSLVPAMGLGLFTAFWGGPGFGGMMGGVFHYSRHEQP